MHALFERGETIDRALVSPGKLLHAAIAVSAQILLRSNSNGILRLQKEPELIRKV